MIALLNILKNFGGKAGIEKESFFVKKEEVFALSGRSRCTPPIVLLDRPFGALGYITKRKTPRVDVCN